MAMTGTRLKYNQSIVATGAIQPAAVSKMHRKNAKRARMLELIFRPAKLSKMRKLPLHQRNC